MQVVRDREEEVLLVSSAGRRATCCVFTLKSHFPWGSPHLDHSPSSEVFFSSHSWQKKNTWCKWMHSNMNMQCSASETFPPTCSQTAHCEWEWKWLYLDCPEVSSPSSLPDLLCSASSECSEKYASWVHKLNLGRHEDAAALENGQHCIPVSPLTGCSHFWLNGFQARSSSRFHGRTLKLHDGRGRKASVRTIHSERGHEDFKNGY